MPLVIDSERLRLMTNLIVSVSQIIPKDFVDANENSLSSAKSLFR
jgi:hypothetical protein